jgi:hypothetical protein
MREVISQAFSNATADAAWLSEAELLPDFQEKALAHLIASPDLITTASGFDLLLRVLRDRQDNDLSYFGKLKTAQLLCIMSELHESTLGINLTLPPLDDLTAADVRLLTSSWKIEELRFGSTAGLELDTLLKSVFRGCLKSISHPVMYKLAVAALNQLPVEEIPQLAKVSVAKVLNDQPICQAIYLGKSMLFEE